MIFMIKKLPYLFYHLALFTILMIICIFGFNTPLFAKVIKKEFIVVYWNKIGWTDNSIVLNKTKYPAGTKLEILRYSKGKYLEIRTKTGRAEKYPIKYFRGGYDSLGSIVTVNWDTTKNHITGLVPENEHMEIAYNNLVSFLYSNQKIILGAFSIFLIILIIFIGINNAPWGLIISGYCFILLGSLQGNWYNQYLDVYDKINWLALNARLPKKADYYYISLIFVPVTVYFLVSTLSFLKQLIGRILSQKHTIPCNIGKLNSQVTKIIVTFNVNLPDETPEYDTIYIIGNFNSWMNPGIILTHCCPSR